MTKPTRREIRAQRRGMLRKIKELLEQFEDGVQYSFVYISDKKKGVYIRLGEITNIPDEAVARFITETGAEIEAATAAKEKQKAEGWKPKQ